MKSEEFEFVKQSMSELYPLMANIAQNYNYSTYTATWSLDFADLIISKLWDWPTSRVDFVTKGLYIIWKCQTLEILNSKGRHLTYTPPEKFKGNFDLSKYPMLPYLLTRCISYAREFNNQL